MTAIGTDEYPLGDAEDKSTADKEP